ncbi:LytTR family DNA-binding domain-containing protein [Chryseobacterium sp. LC2016-29]|uniref:LytR/AlgR family response regulator transcription factor n=1 Tax=Chryseobacterium sp. LC2016-29 TaxID=2897331 RepID=UPI001E2E5939|nr:LytTR family DNA-binding domain-containing protein [Chryseobacterium sp. LC2016-29]MCD0478363.1 LytTR family DNA-binding domain-containing protein [Chryseobacterium sp. LC2016-29]
MIKAIIVDDEKNAVENLRLILEKKFLNEIEIVATANGVDQAYDLFLKFFPELIFLDIEMPTKNGFELLKILNHYDFEVVFVTAFSQYGIDAVKFSALDYVLKPIDFNELNLSIQKAKKRISEKKVNKSLENLIDYLKHENDKSNHKIAISSLKEIHFIAVNGIIRCESSNSYTTIILENQEQIVSTTSLFEYQSLLEKYGFIRCHQSHLVNKNFIKSIKKSEGNILLLTNKDEIPMSRDKKKLVKDQFKL